MSRLAGFTIIALLLGWLLPGHLLARDARFAVEDFFETNRAYKNGQYPAAVDGYRDLIAAGFDNGQVYYNLGNAYFRMGATGQAILSYERAHLLIPRDDDLAFNLALARNQAVDATHDSQAMPLGGLLGLDSLNLYEVCLGFVGINALFFVILGGRLFWKTEWSYYTIIFMGIIVGIAACGFALKWYTAATDDRAVILAPEVVVRAGPNAGDTVLFKIHAGTIVQYERAEEEWVLLHLSADKRGWAAADQLERIVTQKSVRPELLRPWKTERASQSCQNGVNLAAGSN